MTRISNLPARWFVALCVHSILAIPVVEAAVPTLTWDVNGTAPGTGPDVSGFYDGTWGTDPPDQFWTSDPAGVAPPTPWIPGSDAVFIGVNNSSLDGFVTISGTQTANSINILSGIFRFRGGMADTGAGTVTVSPGATLDIDSSQRLNTNAGKVVLDHSTLLQTNPGQAGALIGSGTGLKGLEINGAGTVSYDDGDNIPDDKVSLFLGVITGTGGTPTNGGAGTLTKIGPDQLGVGGSDQGNFVNSQSLFSFAKLVVKQGGYRGRSATINGVSLLDERIFGAVPLAVLPDAITLDGGGIGVNMATTLNPNRGVTIGPNGGYFDHGASASLTIPGPLRGSGTLTIGDVNSTSTANPTFTLSNANNVNMFSGGLVGFRGVLQLNSSLKVASLNDAVTNNASIKIAAGQTLSVGSVDSTGGWSADITGAGGFNKIGLSTQYVLGTPTYTGDTRVIGGTLGAFNPYLADGADLYLSTGSEIDLHYLSTDVIRSLYIDGVLQPAGTWGGPGSSAPFLSNLISGTGRLLVTVGSVPEPGTSVLAVCGLLGCGAIRRRSVRQ